jgi:hypothetical protein
MLRWLKRLGFSFRKLKNKPVLLENPRVVDQRMYFLRTMKRLRASGWMVYYCDETWCGANHTVKYAWQEKIDNIRGGIDFDRGIIQEVKNHKLPE